MATTTNSDYLDERKIDIAEHFNLDPDDIAITNDGREMEFDEPDGKLPRELQKIQLIEAFTEPLLEPDEEPVRPNNIDDFINGMQGEMAAGDTPYVVIMGGRYTGKTTVAKNFAYRIKDKNGMCIKMFAGRRVMRILPEVSNIAYTPEAEAYTYWVSHYRFEDVRGIVLYTDNQQIAEDLLSVPGFKVPLIIEAHEDFDFSKINVKTNNAYPIMPICADTLMDENQRLMVNVVNDRKERYMERFGWVPSDEIVNVITKALSMGSSITDFNFDDVLAVIDEMCGQYASTHKSGSKPNVNSAFKFLADNYGLTKKEYEDIPDTLPIQSKAHGDAVQSVVDQIEKMIGAVNGNKKQEKAADRKPEHKLAFESRESLKTGLESKVIGQKDAIAKVIPALVRRKVGLSDPNKPVANLLFAGPSGVGKTELAKSIAAEAFGSEDNLLRIDCGELSDRWAVSRLLGSMPGYVGYENGGQLSNFVMEHPNSVILFDEIEKADASIYDAILLQLLDAGRITSGKNETIDCTGCIVIMTSNLGADKVADEGMIQHGFTSTDIVDNDEKLQHEVMQAIKDKFRPELINRFDEIIVFNPLTLNNLEQIFDLKWKPFHDRLASKGSEVRLDDSVRTWFAMKSKKDKFGARNIIRMMNKNLIDPLADEILDNKLSNDINVSIVDNNIAFNSAEKQ